MEDWDLTPTEPKEYGELRKILSWRGEDGVTHAFIQDDSAIAYELIQVADDKMWVEMAPF